MIKKIIPLILLFTFVCGPSFAGLTAEQRVNDAQAIIDLFEHRYGPMPWKEELLGIDSAAMAENFLAHAESAQSDEDFYTAVAFYLAGFVDVHVRSIVPSTLTTTLGFDTDDIEGNVIITYIDRSVLPNNTFPFEVGDRLVSIDGFPVNDLRQELLLYRTVGMARPDARMSAMALTWRTQESYPILPEGSSSVTVAPINGSPEQTVEIPWLELGYPLAPITTGLGSAKATKITRSKNILERLRNIKTSLDRQRNAGEFKGNEPFFKLWPDLEKIAGAPILAGTFTMGDMKIAYIRLESFWVPNEQMWKVLAFLEKQIPGFQSNTDALIFDITDNGGGDICYGEAIASFFLREPIDGVRFRARPTRVWTTEIESIIDLDDVQDERHILDDIHGKIRDALAIGSPLTDPFRICQPFEHLMPAKSNDGTKLTYTKPVLILVNEFSASTADAFPAMLQDAGSAKIFGWRTMGAGGNVRDVGPFGNSDILVRVTESLMWREKPVTIADGKTTHYIENIGVVPDYPYDVTMDDFLNGYGGYRAAVEVALKDMMNQSHAFPVVTLRPIPLTLPGYK